MPVSIANAARTIGQTQIILRETRSGREGSQEGDADLYRQVGFRAKTKP